MLLSLNQRNLFFFARICMPLSQEYWPDLRDDCGVLNLSDLAALSLEELLVGAGMLLHQAKALRSHRFLKRAIKEHRLAAKAAAAAAADGNYKDDVLENAALASGDGESSFDPVLKPTRALFASVPLTQEELSGGIDGSVPNQSLVGANENDGNVDSALSQSGEPDRPGSESLLSRRKSTAAAAKRRLSVAQQTRRASIAAVLPAPSSSSASSKRRASTSNSTAAAGSFANTSSSSSDETPFLSLCGLSPSRLEELTAKFASLPDPVVTESDFLWFASLAKDVTLQFEVGLFGNEVRRFRKAVQTREEAIAQAAAAEETQRIAAEAAAVAAAEASHAAHLASLHEEATAAAAAAAEAARVAAEEAAALPLSPPWCERSATEGGDEDGTAGAATFYYWNQYTDETTWERPPPLPEAWYEMPPTDADSPCHFWNEVTNETTWDRPMLPGAVAAAAAAAYAAEAAARAETTAGGGAAVPRGAEGEDMIHDYDDGAVAIESAPQAPESPTSHLQPFAAQFAQEQTATPLSMQQRRNTLHRPAPTPPSAQTRRNTLAPQRRGTTFGFGSTPATKPQRRGTLASFASALFGGDSTHSEPPAPPPPIASPPRTPLPHAAEDHEYSPGQMSPVNEESLQLDDAPDSPTLSDGIRDVERGRSHSSRRNEVGPVLKNDSESELKNIGNVGFDSGFAAQYAQDHTLSSPVVQQRRNILHRPAPTPPSAQVRRNTLAPERRGSTFGPDSIAVKPQRRGTLASFASALFGVDTKPPVPPPPPPKTPLPHAAEDHEYSPGQMSPLNEESLHVEDAPDSPSSFDGEDDVERGRSLSSSSSSSEDAPQPLAVAQDPVEGSAESRSFDRDNATVHFAEEQDASPTLAPQRRNTLGHPASDLLPTTQAHRGRNAPKRRGTMATIVEGLTPSPLPPPKLAAPPPFTPIPPSRSPLILPPKPPQQQALSEPELLLESVPSIAEEQHSPVPTSSSDKDDDSSAIDTRNGSSVVGTSSGISKTRQRLLDRFHARQAIKVREAAEAAGSSLDSNPEYSLDDDDEMSPSSASPLPSSPLPLPSASRPAPPHTTEAGDSTGGLSKMQLRMLQRKAQKEAAAAKVAPSAAGAHSKSTASGSFSGATNSALFTVNEGENDEADDEEQELALPNLSMPPAPTTPPPSRKVRFAAATSPQLSDAEKGHPPLLSTQLPLEASVSDLGASHNYSRPKTSNMVLEDFEAPSSPASAEADSVVSKGTSESTSEGPGMRQGRGRGGGRSGRGSGSGRGGRGRGRGKVDSKRPESSPAVTDPSPSKGDDSPPPATLSEAIESVQSDGPQGISTNVKTAAAALNTARRRPEGVRGASSSPPRPSSAAAAAAPPREPARKRANGREASPPRDKTQERRRASPPRPPVSQVESLSTAREEPTKKLEHSAPPSAHGLEQPPSSVQERLANISAPSTSTGLSKADKKELKALQAKKKAGSALHPEELQRYKALKETWVAESGKSSGTQSDAAGASVPESTEVFLANGPSLLSSKSGNEETAGKDSSAPSKSKPEEVGRVRGRGVAAAFGSIMAPTPSQNTPPMSALVGSGQHHDSSSSESLQPPPPIEPVPSVPLPTRKSPLLPSAPPAPSATTSSPGDAPSSSNGNVGLSKAEKKELKALQTRKKAGDALEGSDLSRYKELKTRFQQAI